MVLKLLARFLGRLSPALLAASQAFAQTPGIMGPDGPYGPRATPPAQPPSKSKTPPLQKWLDQRRHERGEHEDEQPLAAPRPADPEQPQLPAKVPPKPAAPPAEASLRWSLGLLIPKIFELGSRQAQWNVEPGPSMNIYHRLTAGPEGGSFWVGLRLLALSGSVQLGQESGRFGWIYAGPAAAWEWLQLSSEPDAGPAADYARQRLACGFALISRLGEPDLGDRPAEIATRSIGIDGPGLWLEYTYEAPLSAHVEWEFTAGLQLAAHKVLVYAGLGYSLWLDHPS